MGRQQPNEKKVNYVNAKTINYITKYITNELWILEAQIEKIKSKLKNYGMEQNLGMDEELIAVWESAGIGGSSSCNSSDAIRNDGM